MRYFTVNIDEAQRLGLTGSDLLVWGALQYLAKHQAWKGSFRQLAEYSGCGHKDTAREAVLRLINRGLIFKTEAGLSLAEIPSSVAEIPSVVAEKSSKLKESTKENINNKKSLTDNGGSVSRSDSVILSKGFLIFWKKYAPALKYDNRQIACNELWKKMDKEEHRLAVEKAALHLPDTNPYFWLLNKKYLDADLVVGGKEPENPHWLTGEEQHICFKDGVAVYICQNPETGKFGAVTKEDAERFNLVIKNIMKHE